MRRRREEKYPDNGFEAWGGYMNAKIAKLEEQFDNHAAEDKESNIFEGISIYVNGYTKPSSDELKAIMSKHGGTYHTYQKSGDFIIATNLADTKVKRLTTSRIVSPQWITDSLAAKRVLDYKQYLLFSKHTKTQPRLQFTSKSISEPPNIKTEETKPKHCNNEESLKINSVEIPETCDDNISVSTVRQSLNCKRTETNMLSEPSLDRNYNNRMPSSASCSKAYKNETESVNNMLKLNSVEIPETLCENTTCASSNEQSSSGNKIDSVVQLSNDNKHVKNVLPARTAVDPNFLSEFYSNSRLHHISQLGATFKQYINELRENSDFVFPARSKLKQSILSLQQSNEKTITASDFRNGKMIMHIDMDCFFASVGLRSRPELRGAPVAVTHARSGRAAKRSGVDRQTEFNMYRQKHAKAISKATGIDQDTLLEERTMSSRVDDIDDLSSMSEIASCSYEARAKGIRNGMFMGAALKLCPELKTIPYDFEGYREVAYTLYNTIAQYTLDLEAVSCDELYADCTELSKELSAPAELLAAALRREIKEKTGCPCSAGFGGNRLQARLATKKAKPDGQFFLTADLVDSFMMDVKVTDLPGVGRQTLSRVAGLCGQDPTCASLRALSLKSLQPLGAAAAKLLFNYSRGDDDRPLTFHTMRKSVSAEVNYGIRLTSTQERDAFLKQLCSELHSRLLSTNCLARSVTLKLMVRAADAPVETAKFMGHGFCDTINKSSTLPTATQDLELITKHVLTLCNKLSVDPKEMRGVGLQLTKLEPKKKKENPLKAFLVKSEKAKSPAVSPAKEKEVCTNGESQLKTIQVKQDVKVNDGAQSPANEKVSANKENQLKAFLVKQDVKVESAGQSSAKEKEDYGVRDEEIRGGAACMTPKKQNSLNARTPVKLLLRSPSSIKSSPSKSPQRSPARKKTLGLTGRRRGRPPKNASVTTSRSASRTVMKKFLAGERPSHSVEAIDPDFLDSLPDDIRMEVLEYYQPSVVPSHVSREVRKGDKKDKTVRKDETVRKCTSKEKEAVKKELIKSEPDLKQKPHTLRTSTSQDMKTSTTPPENSLMTLPWQQTRELIKSWLSASEPTLSCHVELISSYMQNMVMARNIDKLIVLINFLKRHIQQIQEKSLSNVYSHIIEGIQETMIAVYGKPLLIER